MPENAERIARLEANYVAIDRRAIDHEANDVARFEKVIDRFDERTDEILAKLTPMAQKVDQLWDDKNERRGASRASKYIAGGFGSIIGAGITLVGVLLKRG